MDDRLQDIFARYIGREIDIEERNVYLEDIDMFVPSMELSDSARQTLKEIYDLAQQNGVALRVHLPQMMATADYKPGRLNMFVRKDEDGKWRIQSDFKMG